MALVKRHLRGFAGLAADVVDALHHIRVVTDAGDFERFLRCDEDGLAGGDARVDVLKRLVVPDVAVLQRLIDGRVTIEKRYSYVQEKINEKMNKNKEENQKNTQGEER